MTQPQADQRVNAVCDMMRAAEPGTVLTIGWCDALLHEAHMIELTAMQARLMASDGNGEAIFVVIDETPYKQWNILIIHSTGWYARTFPPGTTGAWNSEWLRVNTVVIA